MRPKTLKIILIITFTALLLSSNSFSSTLSERVHEFNLKNGLKILLMERHTSPTISISMCFKTGSVDEKSGASGIAHLLEHMLFKGTETIGTRDYSAEKKLLKKIDEAALALDREKKKSPQSDKGRIAALAEALQKLQEQHKSLIIENKIDAIYSQNGAEGLNASTGNDVTMYTVSLPANRLELWARIESDRFSNPVFRQFYSERDVVLEELRQSYETKPERKLMSQLLSSAFNAHPYGRPIIGWKSDIQSLSRGTG
ncbi:MAG: insulinase family protein, partial [Pseudomonadota bacterium]